MSAHVTAWEDDRRDAPFDAEDFIRANLTLAPVPALPEISLYAAHRSSGLRRLTMGSADPPPPYWAYPWAGGAALARHVLDRPDTVAGRRVLDLGAGSGIVAIAAAKAGAAEVTAAEIDPHGLAAIRLNAVANGVEIRAIAGDLTAGPPPEADLVLVGDLFYASGLAARVTAFLDRCLASGIEVLVGDPRRADLPRARLRLLVEYVVPDFGAAATASAVFAFDGRDAGAPLSPSFPTKGQG